MTQQDYTAPELPVKVSRKERFEQVLEMYQTDEVTPDNTLSDSLFYGTVLTELGAPLVQATCTRPAGHAVLVTLSTSQMNTLRPGRYRLEVYALTNGEREDLVLILLTVE